MSQRELSAIKLHTHMRGTYKTKKITTTINEIYGVAP